MGNCLSGTSSSVRFETNRVINSAIRDATGLNVYGTPSVGTMSNAVSHEVGRQVANATRQTVGGTGMHVNTYGGSGGFQGMPAAVGPGVNRDVDNAMREASQGIDNPPAVQPKTTQPHRDNGFFNNLFGLSGNSSSGPLVSSVEDFLSMRDAISTTPEGGAVAFIHALINWANASTHAMGEQMVLLSLWEDSLTPGNTYKGYAIHRSDQERLNRMGGPKEYIARSYAEGAVPQNGYAVDPRCVKVNFRPQTNHAGSVASGTVKVFVWCGGADTARPITLKRNSKGLWKVSEFSSITVDIRPPLPSGPTAADVL